MIIIILLNFILCFYDGEYDLYSEVFDVGGTRKQTIKNYFYKKDALPSGLSSERDNRNSSLMRILHRVFFIYYFGENLSISKEEELSILHNISPITHTHSCSKLGCEIYFKIAIEILKYKYNLEEENNLNNKKSLKTVICVGIRNAWIIIKIMMNLKIN